MIELTHRVAQLEEAATTLSRQAPSQTTPAASALKGRHSSNAHKSSTSSALIQDRPEEWLSTADAFRALGGDPEDSDSTVPSLDGTRSVKFNTFRLWQSSEAYEAFGLELNRRRRLSKKPCLRFLSAEMPAVNVSGESA
ncbi:MAG: hypothetical protein Q6L68_05740 [Thermostichus sp. DG02_5_bins_236]